MVDSFRFAIGAKVTGTDGDLGHLTRVIVDPIIRSVTHVVVEAGHDRESARLVPVELVTSAGESIALSCSASQFADLDLARENEFIPTVDATMGYASGEIFTHAYYGLEMGAMPPPLSASTPTTVSIDKVPVGEVEVRRGDPVFATDGPIGHVRGLVVDPSDHHVTHILLESGHLWGHKEVAIPIRSVTKVEAAGAQVSLSKKEIGDLPPVAISQFS